MMKSATAENATTGKWEKWATNPSGDGLFYMNQNNAGAYSQVSGNGQIHFKSQKQFVDNIKKRLSPGYKITSVKW